MATLQSLRFNNRFARLPENFYSRLNPTPLENPKLISFSESAAKLIELDTDVFSQPMFVDYVIGEKFWPGSEPLAMVYAGHQFGVWVPQLGDGRAILLGQVQNTHGESWDLHLKGCGVTPYSRSGDGRAVLRSSIREYLVSEAMVGLNIPSSRGLCLIGSDTPVYRENIETAAMLLRLAPSHVRFGHFEYFYYSNQFSALKTLADHVIEYHFPEVLACDNPYLAFFHTVIEQTAHLIAQWQANGFTHGVMNTDNMSIIGITLDYGPFAFMDRYQSNYIPNHSDHAGRYAFDQQPQVALFNLSCLGQALLPLIGPEPDQAAQSAQDALAQFTSLFNRLSLSMMRRKLGLIDAQESDPELIATLLALLMTQRVDYSVFFRRLAAYQNYFDNSNIGPLFTNSCAFDNWALQYRQRLSLDKQTPMQRQILMNTINPKFILRNHLAQTAIENAQQGDHHELETLLHILQNPYAEQMEYDRYAQLPPQWTEEIVLSCSS